MSTAPQSPAGNAAGRAQYQSMLGKEIPPEGPSPGRATALSFGCFGFSLACLFWLQPALAKMHGHPPGSPLWTNDMSAHGHLSILRKQMRERRED